MAAADTSSSGTSSENTSSSSRNDNNDNDNNEYFSFDGSAERSVLVERYSDGGRPTGYVCAHAVESDGAWLEFYRRRVRLVQYYELLYDCGDDTVDNNVQITVEYVAATLVEDLATTWGLIPSGTACLDHSDPRVLHGLSTGGGDAEHALVRQVGCSILPQQQQQGTSRDEVSLVSSSSSSYSSSTSTTSTAVANSSSSSLSNSNNSKPPQCCQVVRLDLNLLPSLSPSNVLQENVRAYVQDHFNRPRDDPTDSTTIPFRTWAIPDPFMTSTASSSTSTTTTTMTTGPPGSSLHMTETQPTSTSTNTVHNNRERGFLTIMGGTLTSILIASFLSVLFFIGYRRRRRHHQHQRMMCDPHGYEKNNHDDDVEEATSTVQDPDSSDYSSWSNSVMGNAVVVAVNTTVNSGATATQVKKGTAVASTPRDGLFRDVTSAPPRSPAATTTTPSNHHFDFDPPQPPQHQYPCHAIAPTTSLSSSLCLGESFRDHMFSVWSSSPPSANRYGGGRGFSCPPTAWDVDDISEADSWAQTDATVGSLEERLESITAEI
jgi:hypothetical protein